jgi:hypothetical protein
MGQLMRALKPLHWLLCSYPRSSRNFAPIPTLLSEAGILPQRDISMSPMVMTCLQSNTGLYEKSLEMRVKHLELRVNIFRAAFDIQTHILLELVVRAKSLSPQDPQETLRTLRELFCILNNEDASRLRGAVSSLMELCKIHAKEEMSLEKTVKLLSFLAETRTLSLLLQVIFLRYQLGIWKTSLLHPWGQSDRARIIREQMKV